MLVVILEVAATLVFALHLICVNIAQVGPLVCIYFEARANRTADDMADSIGMWLAKTCCVALLAGIALGLIAGGALWWRGDHAFFEALDRIPRARLYWGVVELVFYYVVMLPYAWLWPSLRKWRYLHRILALVAATNLMYHFPPLFAVIGKLSSAHEVETTVLSRSELLQLWMDPQVVALVTHHLLSGVAVVAVTVILRASMLVREASAQEAQQSLARIMRVFAGVALTATLMQAPVGFWILMQLSPLQRNALMGGQWVASGLFLAAMVSVLGLIHALGMVVLGETARRNVLIATGTLALVIVLMSGALRHARNRKLSQAAAVDRLHDDVVTQVSR